MMILLTSTSMRSGKCALEHHSNKCRQQLLGTYSPFSDCRLCAVLVKHPKVHLSRGNLLDIGALIASLIAKTETTTDDLNLPGQSLLPLARTSPP